MDLLKLSLPIRIAVLNGFFFDGHGEDITIPSAKNYLALMIFILHLSISTGKRHLRFLPLCPVSFPLWPG